MNRILLFLILVALSGQAGCGGAATTDVSDVVDDPAGQSPNQENDPGRSDTVCPSLQDSFREMTPATFAVVVVYRLGPQPTNVVYLPIGTAFAIGSRRLATNAHIGRAILDNAFPVENVVAVQAGTGHSVGLLSVVVHPRYAGNPLGSPDVAILNSIVELPTHLELAGIEDLATLTPGDVLALTGFPGDVSELFEIIPGETIPQATSLSGTLTALRTFDASLSVLPQTVDIVQHQLPTTPGTSGAPLVRCGEVIAVHNAGTARIIVRIDENGVPFLDRQGAAANNFGIHVRYLRELEALIDVGLVAPVPLPPTDPNFAGSYECEAYNTPTWTLSHQFFLSISANRLVHGTSAWMNASLELTGAIDRFGSVEFSDDGPEEGLVRTRYSGSAGGRADEITGVFFEGEMRSGEWRCERK